MECLVGVKCYQYESRERWTLEKESSFHLFSSNSVLSGYQSKFREKLSRTTFEMQLTHFSLISSLFFIIGLSNAAATAVNNKTPTPTYPFTLAAFISPYPLFSNNTNSPGVNGVAVHASGGSFYVNPATPSPTPATVFFVDAFGQAFLVSLYLFLRIRVWIGIQRVK